MEALRKELGENKGLKVYLWNAMCHPEIGYEDLRSLLEFCRLLYEPIDQATVVLKLPRYWKLHNLGKVGHPCLCSAAMLLTWRQGKLKFTQTRKTRQKPIEKWKPKAGFSIPAPAASRPIKLKLMNSSVKQTSMPSSTPTPPPPIQAQPQPQPPSRRPSHTPAFANEVPAPQRKPSSHKITLKLKR